MSPRVRGADQLGAGFPRVSGDEPGHTIFLEPWGAFSLREWGLAGEGHGGGHVPVIFPA